jgi:ketosteroid isomerase-like protein
MRQAHIASAGRSGILGSRCRRTALAGRTSHLPINQTNGARALRTSVPATVRRISATWTRLRRESNLTLGQFRAAFLAGNEAFNRGDFAAAFAALPPDCEWHSVAYATERVLVGPEQVCRFFENEIFDMFRGWRSEPVHFLHAGDGVFVVLLSGHGTGSSSGAPVHLDLAEVWELRGGIPVRVREFPTWEEALSAADLDLSKAGELRKSDRSGA